MNETQIDAPTSRRPRPTRRFLADEDGPTAVEYAVMLALIIVACITIVTNLGRNVSSTYNKVNTALSS